MQSKGNKMSEVYIPKTEEKLSAHAFVKMLKTDADNVKNVRFVYPTIGKKGFGYFKVRYNTPVLRKVNLNYGK